LLVFHHNAPNCSIFNSKQWIHYTKNSYHFLHATCTCLNLSS
jgi:hypothetical protein